MNERLLSQHFANLLKRLQEYAIDTKLAEHPDVIGLAREGFVRMFLEENLPSLVDYRTGEIIDEFDNRSGQIDLILQSALSPRVHLFGNMQIAFADFVLGTIEVKSTLTTASWGVSSHLKSALDSFQRVKALHRAHKISATPTWKKNGPLILSNTPCFLIAYHGPKRSTLEDKLLEYGQVNGLRPQQF